jgi:signal transduction histidine kinase/DNA-binding response OmpR family regulator
MFLFKTGLKQKILSMIFILIACSAAILIFNTYLKLKEDIFIKNNEIFNTFNEIFINEKDLLIKKYSMSLDILTENQEVLSAFAARDKQRLKGLTDELFESRLKNIYNIEQFQFHVPPAKSFYRVHAPDRNGDDLSAFRKTVVQANSKKSIVAGLEVGRAGLGLRVVKPIWYKYGFIGTVEFGGDISNIMQIPETSTGVQSAVAIHRKVLDKSKFFYGGQIKNLYQEMFVSNFSSNIVRELVKNDSFSKEGKIIKKSNAYYITKKTPLKDFSGNSIGYLLLSRDTTKEVQAMQSELIKQILIILLFASVALIIISSAMIKLVFGPLESIAKHISKIDYTKNIKKLNIDIKYDSEIKEVAEAFNIMSDKLSKSFGQISDQMEEIKNINSSLEFKVKDRTRELEEANAQLTKALDKIQMNNDAKSEMLASVSHEIRTPMNAILGLSYLVMQSDLDSKQYDYVSKIKKSANLLLEIINDILDFSKIEAGKLELENKTFSISDIVENIQNLVQVQKDEKDIEIIYNIAENIPAHLQGDQLRITQVLTNLMTNAVKFTDKGHVKMSVFVMEASMTYVTLNFLVEDTGIGIEKDKIKKLFNPFAQAEVSTSRKYGGSGLGLNISNKILEKMNSGIEIESVPGKGSVFSFSLKLKISDGLNSEDSENEYNILEGKRILVAEKYSDSSGSISAIYREYMANVMAVENQISLIKALNNNITAGKNINFDLMIFDCGLNDISPIEAIKAIKKHSDIEDFPPIITLTNQEMDYSGCPVDNMLYKKLNKPCDPEKLYGAAVELLSQTEDSSEKEIKVYDKHIHSSINALVVDDNEINRQVASEFLSMIGIKSHQATNGKEAVKLLESIPIDIIFMDIVMPEMNGIQATKAIRSNEKTKSIPIYAMTARTMPEDTQQCKDAGMNGYILKPLQLQDITQAVSDSIKVSVTTPENVTTKDIPNSEDNTLSIKAGLINLCNNHDLYMQLIEKFYHEYKGLKITLGEHIENNDRYELIRFLHSIKGISKTIGAINLSVFSQELEKSARNGEDITMSDAFEKFNNESILLDEKLKAYFGKEN